MLLAVLWLFQTPLWAVIYQWKDDQGKANFTDDRSKIPSKYRNQAKKFKGVTEPKPEPVEEPVEAEKEAVASKPEAGEKKGGGKEKKKDLKLIAMLKETIGFLEDENRVHQNLVGSLKPDEQNGVFYMATILDAVVKKERFIKKLKGYKLPSLQEARSFLKGTLSQDKLEEIGGEGFLERVKNLKKRLESEITSKKKIIKKLQSDRDKEDKSKKKIIKKPQSDRDKEDK
jgi:hypothetical protein